MNGQLNRKARRNIARKLRPTFKALAAAAAAKRQEQGAKSRAEDDGTSPFALSPDRAFTGGETRTQS